MDPVEIIMDSVGILTVIVLFIIGLIYTCKQLRSMKKDRHSDLLMNLTNIWDSEHYRESRAIIAEIDEEDCERPTKTNGNSTKVYNKEDVTRTKSKSSEKYCFCDKLKECKKKDPKVHLCIFGVPDFFENMGWLVKNGYIEDPHVITDLFGNSIVYYYDLFKEYINSSRDEIPDLLCYFEKLRDLVEDTRLLMFLVDKLQVGWAGNAEIDRSDGGKPIRIFKGRKSAEIKIDKEKGEVILKINGETRDITEDYRSSFGRSSL